MRGGLAGLAVAAAFAQEDAWHMRRIGLREDIADHRERREAERLAARQERERIAAERARPMKDAAEAKRAKRRARNLRISKLEA